MTKAQKEMLAQIAAGADVNEIVKIARLQGNERVEQQVYSTILALFKQRMLRLAGGRTGETRDLEISDLGRETAAKHVIKDAKQAAKDGAK